MLEELFNQIGIIAFLGGGLLLWLAIRVIRSIYVTVTSICFMMFGIMRLMTFLDL